MDPTLSSDDTEASSESADSDFLVGFISEQAYACRRGVTVRTCQRDRQMRRAPPHIKLGRRILYRVDALRDWLVKNERIADQTPDQRRVRSCSYRIQR
jgi:hypothetical protein